MKRLIPLVLTLLLLTLVACGDVQYVSNDYHFQINFPEDMAVFSPIETKQDDPRLKEYGVNYEDLKSFGTEDGLFYAVGQSDGVREEITVTVTETDFAQELWHLQEGDTTSINEFEALITESFTSSDYMVLSKGILQQKDACCIFLNVATGAVDGVDLIYMATVYNGLHYAVTYQTSVATSPDDRQEIYKIFETFYMTEKVANPNEEPKDDTVAKAILAIVLILIVAALVVLVIRLLLVRKPKQTADSEEYTPLFQDSLTKKTKDKK